MLKRTTLLCACALAFAAEAGTLKMQNIAHRGMWDRDCPQNTVEAIRRAYESGATWVETDFWHVKSGLMVCMHMDRELAEYAQTDKKTIDLTAEDLATLNLGAKDRLPKPFRIPTLDQVLAVVPKTCVVQAEIKHYTPQYAELFDQAVAKAGLTERNVVVSSFDYKALKDFKARHPRYRAVWLTGLRKPKEGAAFDVKPYIAKCKDAKFEVFCPGCGSTKNVMTPADADAVRAAGLEFRLYGVNSLADLRQAKALGAAGFTCNYWKQAFDWAKSVEGVELVK